MKDLVSENESLPLEHTLRKLPAYVVAQRGVFEITRLTPEAVEFIQEEIRKQLQSQATKIIESQKSAYSNAFYMGAGLSAFAGIVGYAYFGGYLGLLLGAAAMGPFLMSILGLHYSREQ